MTTGQALLTLWSWQPSVLLGAAALLAGYVRLARPSGGRAALFLTGMLILVVALLSPIDTLGDGYLFSVHMLQHLLLVLIVPPLLLLGIPRHAAARVLAWPPARRAEHILGRPLLAWLIGTATLWVWHAPALYDLALQHEGIHVVQHLTFLVSATVFWWPVLAPTSRRRLGPLAAVFYLLGASIASSLLGVILTFAPVGFYPFYVHPVDTLGLLPLIRQGWGITPAVDQQWGGLLMWILGDPIYLLVVAGILAQWYNAEGQDAESYAPLAGERPEYQG